MVLLVTFFNGYAIFLDGNFNTTNFIIAYITLVIFAVLFVFWKLYKKTKFVSLAAMDVSVSPLSPATRTDPRMSLV